MLSTTRSLDAVLVALEDAVAAGHALVHGADPAHSHGAALAALDAARRAGAPVAVLTTLTRSNARSMRALAALLVAHGVTAWRITLTTPHDEADAARRLPSLGVALPHVLLAVEQAARQGVQVSLRGLPHCVLGPYARWHADAPTAPASGSPCDDCAAHATCPGLSPLHRARFGARELAARPPVEADADPARRASERLFAR